MRLSNIASTFKKCRQEHRPALLTYTVSGDPNKKSLMKSLKLFLHMQIFVKLELGTIAIQVMENKFKIAHTEQSKMV